MGPHGYAPHLALFRTFLMKQRYVLPVALLLSGCAGGTRSASPPDPALVGPPIAVPSVFALIGAREELGLSSRQVTTLDSIAVWLGTENQPFIRELRPLETAGGGSRRRGMSGRAGRAAELTDEARAALERVRENNARVMRVVEQTLTPDQRTRVCELERKRREARTREFGRGENVASRRHRPPPGMAPDTTRGMRPGGWSWCVDGAGNRADAAPGGGGAT